MSSGSRLLLLHPVGQDGACWRWLELEHLAELAFTPDLPGHGSNRTRPTTLAATADEVAGELDGELDVVGVAMGAMVAQHVLLRHPERVRSAILFCAHGSANASVYEERARAAAALGMEAVLDSTLERWFTPAAMAATGHPGVAYAREQLLSMDSAAYAASWRAMGAHQTLDALTAVSRPVTVVAGALDKAISVGEGCRLQEWIPRSRFEVIEAPHMAHLERPELVSAAIARHLAWASEGAGKLA